jgi:hypothetical protein
MIHELVIPHGHPLNQLTAMSQDDSIYSLYAPNWEIPIRILPKRLAHIQNDIEPFPLDFLSNDHTRIPPFVLVPLWNIWIYR